MKLYDFAMMMPYAFMATFLKSVRVDIDSVGKEEILKNGLYHITPNEEVSEKIINSGYLKPATGIAKNINSYGTASVCLFNGTPDIYNYTKNMVNSTKDNVYLNPTLVKSAIKLLPTEKELLNYKSRALIDNAIIYEGYCVLPKDRASIVHLVPDLIRNEETGKPIVNEKTGRYEISFREAKLEELQNDGKSYNAPEDYLQFVEEERKRLGYIKGNNIISNAINMVNTVIHVSKIEGLMGIHSTKENFLQILKRKFQQIKMPKLETSSNEKIDTILAQINHKSKNPYRNKSFSKKMAELSIQGKEQLNLQEELENITTSKVGEYIRNKFEQIDKEAIIKEGIHGISHNNRVALLATMIAEKESIFKDDIDNRKKDLLLSAVYYHDIGRKKGAIVDNIGPHAKNSAKNINSINLSYLNGKEYSEKDRRILQAIVEAHEGKDSNINKICEKYQIDKADLQLTQTLTTVLKDADALDRVRIDINTPMAYVANINIDYLRTSASKQMIDLSYQLEELSKKVSFEEIYRYKVNEKQSNKENSFSEKQNEFFNRLQKGVSKETINFEKSTNMLENSIKQNDRDGR